jgi:FAD:protein FMN transferase
MTAITARGTELSFRSMATTVTIQLHDPNPGAPAALERARDVFGRVEAACTRFDPTSALMRANADPTSWHQVPWECAAAVAEAARAHEESHGLFDPRVLDALVDLGYDRTLPFGPARTHAVDEGHSDVREPALDDTMPSTRAWRPQWDIVGRPCRLHLDGARIDLGGIGKGLAVRWAAQELHRSARTVMVDAGGDCQFLGDGPDGDGWRVGMEDPRGGDDPLLVFELRDVGCATSSVRVRHWMKNGRHVHHLIDPRTGYSGGAGLLAVTVIHRDAAWAEVWSKSLFLSGPQYIEALADEQGLPAAWVDSRGRVQLSRAAAPFVIWMSPHA